MIDSLLLKPLLLVELVEDKHVLQDLFALFNLGEIKALASVVQARISASLASNTVSPETLRKLIETAGKEKSYLLSVKHTALPEFAERVEAFESDSVTRQENSLRQRMITSFIQGQVTGDKAAYVAASSQRIKKLNGLEHSIIEDLHAYVEREYKTQWLYIVLNFVAIVLVLALSWGVSMIIVGMRKQAHQIDSTVNRIIDSDDLTLRIEQRTQDMLGEAAKTFNQLLTKISADFGGMADIAYESVASTHDTVVAVVEAEKNISEQKLAGSDTTSAMEALSNSAKDIGTNIADTMSAVSTMDKSIESGTEVISRVVSQIKQVAAEISKLTEAVTSLNQGVSDISGFISDIQSVSEQTNLLALNAAIEAARAGEHGRGFAVVADEVRTLATRVNATTDQINSIIGSLQTNAEGANTRIVSFKDSIDIAVKETDSVTTVLGELNENIGNVSNAAQSISTSASQQQQVVQRVNDIVRRITQMSEQNEVGAKEIISAATELSDATMQMINVLDKYNFDGKSRLVKPSKWKYGDTH